MKESPQEMFVYSKLMEAVKELQGERAAIILLEDANGGTTYLRHKISKEDAAQLLKESYSI